MSSSNRTLTFIVIVFLLHFVHMVIADDPTYLVCSTSSDNFTSYSPYEQNLNKLLGELNFKTSQNGFANGSVGQYQTQTYGLSLCRGDVSPQDCITCIANACSEIRKRCPTNKAATIWYDQCMLKYSDTNFFGQIDNQGIYMWNVNNVSDPVLFNMSTKRLLNGLSNMAYTDPKMFAAGVIDLEGSQKLYGLVQCTGDLSSGDCKTCLDSTISQLPNCCDGKQGGRIVGGSCNIRYEMYPFLSI